jgi:hypothetical protein
MKLVALTVSHDNVAKSIDMSDVDRHRFGYYAAGLKAPSCSAFAHTASCPPARFLPGRADPDPSGSSRMLAPCGLVGAEKVLAESSGPFQSLQVPDRFSSQIAHIANLPSIMHESI